MCKTAKYISISFVYTLMGRIKIEKKTRLTVNGIEGFIKKTVTPFGNGAKVDCPKEYLGRPVYLVILKE